MRNRSLHRALEQFIEQSAWQLADETSRGLEIPYEVVEQGRGGAPLYCYRPLTRQFIHERLDVLKQLAAYRGAVEALAGATEGLKTYLEACGDGELPTTTERRAEASLWVFVDTVFADASEFAFERSRFNDAYRDLERILYEGRVVTTAVLPLYDVQLESSRVVVTDDMLFVRLDSDIDLPPEVDGLRTLDGNLPTVVAVLTVDAETSGSVQCEQHATSKFHDLLTALALFGLPASAAAIGWLRTDAGPWRVFGVGNFWTTTFPVTSPSVLNTEFAEFYSSLCERIPSHGELAWALNRFEQASRASHPAQALTDYLLALRALLEPEGPQSGQLAQRLATLCGTPETRSALAERVAHIVSLERTAIAGLLMQDVNLKPFIRELHGWTRALLRDVIFGHLDSDLRMVAERALARR